MAKGARSRLAASAPRRRGAEPLEPVGVEEGFSERPAMEGYFPHLVSRLMNRLNLELLDLLTLHGVTVQQWRVMQFLHGRDGATINEISRDIVLKQPSVSRVVGQLEQRALARRQKKGENARFVQVFLTEKARRILEDVTPLAQGIIEDALSDLSRAERSMLHELLQRVFAHVNRPHRHRRSA